MVIIELVAWDVPFNQSLSWNCPLCSTRYSAGRVRTEVALCEDAVRHIREAHKVTTKQIEPHLHYRNGFTDERLVFVKAHALVPLLPKETVS